MKIAMAIAQGNFPVILNSTFVSGFNISLIGTKTPPTAIKINEILGTNSSIDLKEEVNVQAYPPIEMIVINSPTLEFNDNWNFELILTPLTKLSHKL